MIPKSVPVMHSPVLPILVICCGLAGVILARVLLLPCAKTVQARQGYSDQFVTDLALALPLSAFILGTVAGLIWLVR
jgi:formate-dependent nitrite reductase membrane component NrfD